MTDTINILLATFNGAPYLPAQLDSLLAQTCQSWHLLVRDDCSSDATPSILAEYQSLFHDKITIISNDGKQHGAAGNFSLLMSCADADYLMFCDQDDVWFPDKIEKTLGVMHTLEQQHGTGLPLLVHTDLTVTDENLVPVATSLWGFQHSDAVGGLTLNRLLLQNTVTGCTVLINRPLRDLAQPVSNEALMHDWWLALVAAAFGRIGRVVAPTMLYRQHGANDVGAIGFNLGDFYRRFSHWSEINEVIRKLYRQAGAFLERYRDRLSPAQREMLEAFATMDEAGGLERRRRILKYRFFYAGLVRNVGRFLIG